MNARSKTSTNGRAVYWYHIRFACGRPWVRSPVCPLVEIRSGRRCLIFGIVCRMLVRVLCEIMCVCVCVYTCEFRRGSTCMFVSGWGRRGGDIVDTDECWARFPGAALSYVLSLAMRASHAMRRWWATQKHRGHRRTIARTPELPTTMEYRTSATAERNSAQPHTHSLPTASVLASPETGGIVGSSAWCPNSRQTPGN